MEELTEQIAGEVGPKWVQLLSRLRLDYRERYKLCAKHKDVEKNVQEANCTRDTIRLWQNGLGSDVPEMEVMTQLLAAFKTVKGFDERAGELAKSRGISLTVPQPPTTSSHEPTGSNIITTSAEGHPLKHSPSQLAHHTTVDTGSILPAFLPGTPGHSSTVEAHTDADTEEGGSDAELSNLLPSYRPSAITAEMQQEQQVPNFGSRSPTLSSTSSTERSDDHHLLNSTIDMSLMKHKYAILDVCQRLPPTVSVMNDFAQRLNVPQDKVRQITNDSTMQEERYYQMLKFWLGEGGGGESKRTFMELRDALVSCQQLTASDIILRRLQSPGLTLRSPQVQRDSPQLVL